MKNEMGFWDYCKFFIVSLKFYKLYFSIFLLGLFIQLVYLGSLPLLYREIFDNAIKHSDLRLLFIIIAIITIGLFAKTVADFACEFFISRIGTGIMTETRLKMFKQLENLPVDYYQQTATGDILSLFSTDLAAIENAFLNITTSLLKLLLLAFISLFFLFWQEWHLALIVLFLSVFAILLQRRLLVLVNRTAYARKQEDAGFLAMIYEIISTHLIIRLFNLYDFWLDKVNTKLHQLSKVSEKTNLYSLLVPRGLIFSTGFIETIVITVGAFLVIQGTLTLGMIISFMTFAAYILSAAEVLAGSFPFIFTATAGMQRINKLLHEKPEVLDMPQGQVLPQIKENILFQNVSFGYPGKKIILHDINIKIRIGEAVAFVGMSGSGKTTLMSLLMRLYHPTLGKILVDNQYDLQEVQDAAFHAFVGVVLQESLLFNMSIRDNIRMGRLNANEAEIIEVAKKAGIHFDILAFPEGYDTIVGERGGQLSGGQRQRIALARSLIRNPSILLLDEVTSGLDPFTEMEINKTLLEQAKSCTLIAITHRLNLAVDMDRIFVLEHGHIVEVGKHAELLEKNGVYARLWHKQTGVALGPKVRVDLSYLHTIPLLQPCDRHFLHELTKHFLVEGFGPNTIVFEEGSVGDKFYLIVRGQVTVHKPMQQGKGLKQVAILEEGDYFGEIALLHNTLHNATIITQTPCMFLVLHQKQFNELLEGVPTLRAELEKIAAERK